MPSSSSSRAVATRSACSTSWPRSADPTGSSRSTSTTACGGPNPTPTRTTSAGCAPPPPSSSTSSARRPPPRAATSNPGRATSATRRRSRARETTPPGSRPATRRPTRSRRSSTGSPPPPAGGPCSGWPPVDGILIRPLLGVTRELTADYCRERGLDWREDSTNSAGTYARNRARHGLAAALGQLHPAASANVARTARLLRDEAAVLDEVVSATLDGRDRVPVARLAELSPALARLVVIRMAEDAAGRLVPGAGHRLPDLLGLAARGGSAQLDIGGGVRAIVEYGILRFEPDGPRLAPEAVGLPIPGTARFGSWQLDCTLEPPTLTTGVPAARSARRRPRRARRPHRPPVARRRSDRPGRARRDQEPRRHLHRPPDPPGRAADRPGRRLRSRSRLGTRSRDGRALPRQRPDDPRRRAPRPRRARSGRPRPITDPANNRPGQ